MYGKPKYDVTYLNDIKKLVKKRGINFKLIHNSLLLKGCHMMQASKSI